MKKIIALVMVVSILFCFTACNNTSMDFIDEPVELDVEMLKENWGKGKITFANGQEISIPCTPNAIEDISELVNYDADNFVYRNLEAKSSIDNYLADRNTMILATYSNFSDKNEVSVHRSTVVAITIEDIKEGNRSVKIGGTLTTGVARADVEKALGIPEDSKAGDETYTYVNDDFVCEIKINDPELEKDTVYKTKHLVLEITFNEKDVVSKIVYKVVME